MSKLLTLNDIESSVVRDECAARVAQLGPEPSARQINGEIRATLAALLDQNRLLGALPNGGVVRYLGERLPGDAYGAFSAGAPSTNVPDDDYPVVVGALLSEYCTEGDSVLGLWVRSAVFQREAAALGLNVSLYDPYGFALTDWVPLDALSDDHDLAYVHLACPGIVNRRQVHSHGYGMLDHDNDPLECFSHPDYLEAAEELIMGAVWSLGRDGVLAVLSRRYAWEHRGAVNQAPFHPHVAGWAADAGLRLIRQHDCFFEVGSVPARLWGEMSHAVLQVFL